LEVTLSLKSAKQTINVPYIEVNGMTVSEIEKYVYDRYVPSFINLHSNVEVNVIGLVKSEYGIPIEK
jgi:hypothetical protein